jgi:hypothetical protein
MCKPVNEEDLLYQITVRMKTIFSQVLDLMFDCHQRYLTVV